MEKERDGALIYILLLLPLCLVAAGLEFHCRDEYPVTQLWEVIQPGYNFEGEKKLLKNQGWTFILQFDFSFNLFQPRRHPEKKVNPVHLCNKRIAA